MQNKMRMFCGVCIMLALAEALFTVEGNGVPGGRLSTLALKYPYSSVDVPVTAPIAWLPTTNASCLTPGAFPYEYIKGKIVVTVLFMFASPVCKATSPMNADSDTITPMLIDDLASAGAVGFVVFASKGDEFSMTVESLFASYEAAIPVVYIGEPYFTAPDKTLCGRDPGSSRCIISAERPCDGSVYEGDDGFFARNTMSRYFCIRGLGFFGNNCCPFAPEEGITGTIEGFDLSPAASQHASTGNYVAYKLYGVFNFLVMSVAVFLTFKLKSSLQLVDVSLLVLQGVVSSAVRCFRCWFFLPLFYNGAVIRRLHELMMVIDLSISLPASCVAAFMWIKLIFFFAVAYVFVSHPLHCGHFCVCCRSCPRHSYFDIHCPLRNRNF
jgi:hypothetical protein